MQYRRISADCHLDMPWMPPELFVENASRELKDRMPYVDGRAGRAALGRQERRQFRPDERRRPGRREATCRGRTAASTSWPRPACSPTPRRAIRWSATRICASRTWTRDGVDAEVIFGVLGSASKLNDSEAANEMLRIYNDWLKDFCSHYPDRQIGLACLPYGDIDAAVKEIHRVAKMGLRGPRAVVLVGHGADVAPELGAAVEGGRRGRSCRCISTPSRPPPPRAREMTRRRCGARRCSPACRRSRWG